MSHRASMIVGMDDGTSDVRIRFERNLRLIPLHAALARSFVWIPIFELFTRARFGLDGAIALTAVYFLAVVAFEVPSGWMSDRLGRALTLRLAAACWVAANLCLLLAGGHFAIVVAAQVLLAAGYACLSGTDVTFHLDTLEALGLEGGYARRQGRVSALALAAGAAGAVVGGVLGAIDLRIVFVVSLGAAVVQLAVALMLVDPVSDRQAAPLPRQLADCAGYLRDRTVAWTLLYGAVMVTLTHAAFTLMQPWLTAALGRSPDDVGATPLVAGMAVAATAAVAAVAAHLSAPTAERVGTVPTLLALAAVSAIITTGMALFVHVAVLALYALRSAQDAAASVLIAATVAPATDPRHRATLLSADSLAGRLGYGALLVVLTAGGTDDPRRVLGILSVVSWALVAVLVGTAVLTRNLGDAPVRRRGSGMRRCPSRSPRRARRSAA